MKSCGRMFRIDCRRSVSILYDKSLSVRIDSRDDNRYRGVRLIRHTMPIVGRFYGTGPTFHKEVKRWTTDAERY
jgi:hypothetical protein